MRGYIQIYTNKYKYIQIHKIQIHKNIKDDAVDDFLPERPTVSGFLCREASMLAWQEVTKSYLGTVAVPLLSSQEH